MNIQLATWAYSTAPRLIVVNGPPGFGVSEALALYAGPLGTDDVLVIAEHDDARSTWLDNEPLAIEPTARSVLLDAGS